MPALPFVVRWWVPLGLALAVALIAGLTLAFLQYTQDDVFITYVYSRNLIRGEGFVFNPGEAVQGTTTPLWTLVMAGTYVITPNMLHAGNLLGGVLLMVTAGLAASLIRPVAGRIAQIALVLLIASAPLFYISLGMETLLYCALLVGGWVLWQHERVVLAMVVAGLLTWTRADGIVLGGVFGLLLIYDVLRDRSSDAVRRMVIGGLAYVAAAAPWFIFAMIYFGSPLPNTFGAKADVFEGLTFLVNGWGVRDAIYGGNPLHWLALPLIVIGLIRALRVDSLRAVGLWVVLYLVGYTVLDASEFWYYTPLLVGLLILTAVGGQVVGEWLFARLTHNRLRAGLRLAALSLVMVSVGIGTARALDLSQPPQRTWAYEQVGLWLQSQTATDSSVMVADLGIMGYYAERRMIDSFGLIVPDLYTPTVAYTVFKYLPDYAVATRFPPWPDVMASDAFRARYRPVYALPTPQDVEFSPVTVFQRRYPLDLPETVVQGEPVALSCVVERDARERLPNRTRARLFDQQGERVARVSQPFMGGMYPDERALGDERLSEQIIVPTAGLSIGSYTWELVCDDVTTSGDIEVIPLAIVEGYQAVDAVWPDVGTLHGVWLPGDMAVWPGATVPIAFDFEAGDVDESVLWMGVEVIDRDGVTVAEGLLLPDPPTAQWSVGERMPVVGELTLPVTMSPGTYRVVVNWIDVDAEQRLPLDDRTQQHELPLTLTVLER